MKTATARRPDSVSLMAPAIRRLEEGGAVTLARAPEGYDAFIVAELTRALAKDGEQRAVTLAFVARDSLRAQAFIDALSFAAPEIEALYFPSWDCQPYDRVSPNAAVSAERMTVLARLAKSRGAVERPRILVASVNALTQRAPPFAYLKSAAFSAAPGNSVRTEDLTHWLEFERLFARQHRARRRRLRLAGRHSRSLSARRSGADPPRFLRRYARIDPRLRSRDAALDHAIALARSRADERGASHNRLDQTFPPGLCGRVRRAGPQRRSLRRDQPRPPRDWRRTLAAAHLR